MTEISYEEFVRLDFRIGRVVEAEKIHGSNKLLRLQIDIGGKKLQSISGITEQYGPEELLNRLVAVIVNLKPRKVFGNLSEVMLLAALDKDKISILKPDKEITEGSKVS
jgi:methionine--tRNA ligase beta chain